jgi:diaminopimelate decarboxylase
MAHLNDCLSYRTGRLYVESVAAERIAREAGTPTYVYSARLIREKFQELDSALGNLPHLICYALKANPNRSLCRLLAKEGAGADVVSGGELRQAIDAGIRPGKIVFAGVGKTEDEIILALRSGIRMLNVESQEELEAVTRLAKRVKRPALFAVRVNPGVDAGTHRHVATGLPDSKFGVVPAEALRMYRQARTNPWLKAVGIHCHIGSQITRVQPYQQALDSVLKLASKLRSEGQHLKYLDLGGGLGICHDQEEPLPIPAFARMLRRELAAWPGLELVLEPGRFLVAEAGIILTRVLYRKRTSRAHLVIVDVGMNDLLRPALYGAKHPVIPGHSPQRPKIRLNVAGPVCESADMFARGEKLPWPKPRELWAILKAGAYAFSMSSQYNSRPRPPEVLVEGRNFRLIRAREQFEDLVRHER